MFVSRAEQDRVNLLLGVSSTGESNLREGVAPLDIVTTSFRGKLHQLCNYAGLDDQRRNILLIRISIWLAAAILLLVSTGSLFLGGIPLVVLLGEILLLKRKVRVRAKLFDQDYCALLLSIASSVKSGADPILALSQAISLFPSETVMNGEVQQFKHHLETGLTEEQALMRFGSRISNRDIDMFRTAMVIARKEGSALGECLQRLAKVTRQRQSFSRKVKSAVAMQKLASWGIGACTIAIGFIQYFANPESLHKAWDHPIGFPVMIIGLSLIAVGFIWMRKLSGREM
jgi:tight adherence protein B